LLDQFINPTVTVEAGSHGYWLIDYWQDNNINAVLSHPQKTKAIASAKIMTDKMSSETLAHLLRSNLLPTAYILPQQFRQTTDLLRHRAALTIIRTGLKNRIHAFHCPLTVLFSKSGRNLA